MPVTPTELAGYLQRDLDSYSATQAVNLAVAILEDECGTKFSPTTVTYATTTTHSPLVLPYRPVTAVSAVRVAGVVVAATEYVVSGSLIFRVGGFGNQYSYLPEAVQVDLTYGYTDIPADAKPGVLDLAAMAYDAPGAYQSQQIDDYAERLAASGFQLPPSARAVIARYRLPTAV